MCSRCQKHYYSSGRECLRCQHYFKVFLPILYLPFILLVCIHFDFAHICLSHCDLEFLCMEGITRKFCLNENCCIPLPNTIGDGQKWYSMDTCGVSILFFYFPCKQVWIFLFSFLELIVIVVSRFTQLSV